MPTVTRTTRAASLLLLGALAVAPAANGQTDVDRENAQALYKAGNDARDAGDANAALTRYRAAFALVRTPVIAVALGKAEAAVGQLIEARQTWLAVDKIAVKASESELTTSARAEASALAAQIEARIPSATFAFAGPTGAAPPALSVDGATVPEEALAAPRKMNPGAHVAVATIGGATTETRFTLAESQTAVVTVERPAVAPPANPPLHPAAPTSPVVTAPEGRPSRVPAVVALGVGGAGVVVTAVFGALAFGKKSSLDRACGADKAGCPASAQPDIDALHADAIASDVGLGVAIAGLGVGAALLLLHRGGHAAEAPATGAIRVEPWAGAGAGGLRGSF